MRIVYVVTPVTNQSEHTRDSYHEIRVNAALDSFQKSGFKKVEVKNVIKRGSGQTTEWVTLVTIITGQ